MTHQLGEKGVRVGGEWRVGGRWRRREKERVRREGEGKALMVTHTITLMIDSLTHIALKTATNILNRRKHLKQRRNFSSVKRDSVTCNSNLNFFTGELSVHDMIPTNFSGGVLSSEACGRGLLWDERLTSHSEVSHWEGEGPREPTLENWPTTGQLLDGAPSGMTQWSERT